MSRFNAARSLVIGVLLAASGAAAYAQRDEEPETGATFQCQDGTKMVLAFAEASDGIDAVIRLHGATYRLAYQEPKPGPAQVVWSDGNHSLTWSPGVQLMWMATNTHLMCGRGGHKH